MLDKFGKFLILQKIPFYLVDPDDTGHSERNIVVSAYAVKSGDSDIKVTFNDYSLGTVTAWQDKTATLTATSATNLCSDTGNITVYITVSNATTGSLYIQRQKYINLSCVGQATSGGVQTCAVFYKP